jgi:competence protein ComEA
MEPSATPWRVFDAPGAEARPEDAPAGPQRGALTGGQPGLRRTVDLRAPSTRAAMVGLGMAFLIGAVAISIAVGGSGDRVAEGPEGSAGVSSSARAPDTGEILVDVTGAVTRPGLYRLRAGSRIGDAIAAAGGFSPRVDADRVAATLNLAAPLDDGSQVHVAARGESSADTATGGSAGSAGAGSAGAGLIDLNTATQSELESLPGIGPVTAKKIMDSRASAPFDSVSELRERGLVGEKTFQQVQPLVTVH